MTDVGAVREKRFFCIIIGFTAYLKATSQRGNLWNANKEKVFNFLNKRSLLWPGTIKLSKGQKTLRHRPQLFVKLLCTTFQFCFCSIKKPSKRRSLETLLFDSLLSIAWDQLIFRCKISVRCWSSYILFRNTIMTFYPPLLRPTWGVWPSSMDYVQEI